MLPSAPAPRRFILLALLLALSAPFARNAAAHDEDSAYDYYLSGNAADVQKATRGLLVLQGGGDDVDENYRRMGEFGGGGDFVVLRASGEDEYNDYIYKLCGCDSVETIVFKRREAAYDPFVIRTIRNAEAIFIAGGDQSRYVLFWQYSPVQDAINFVAAKPAPIGGTSAGMAVMGEFVYSAMTESVTTGLSLANPFYADVTLARDFLALPGMKNIITDQHLQERQRIGRTLAFMARLISNGWTGQARAIAADRETAVHFDPATGLAEVFATPDHETPYAYFMRSTAPPERCAPGQPLTFRGVDVYRVGPGGRFDLNTWTGADGIAYTLSAENGKLVSSRDSAY
jgi:cyanophycinase